MFRPLVGTLHWTWALALCHCADLAAVPTGPLVITPPACHRSIACNSEEFYVGTLLNYYGEGQKKYAPHCIWTIVAEDWTKGTV